MLAVRRVLEQAPVGCALCTGRQEAYGEAVIQALNLFRPLPDSVRQHVRSAASEDLVGWPSILENGAYLYDPVTKRPMVHPALTAARVSTLQRMRAEVLAPLVERTGAQFEPSKDFCISLNPPPVRPGSRERQATDEFRPLVEAAIGEYSEEVEIRHSASAVDITPRGVSKASAVQMVLEWTGLSPAEVLGVGDTRADEAWLSHVGWRAAPANGRDQLVGLDYYSPHEVTVGLLDILRWLHDTGYAGL
jgi:hydroxymethylpyrimidine pyrophosphatase-like HAD family hydrolase